MYFVFGLPAESLSWCRRGQCEEDTGIKPQRSRSELMDCAKHLRPDAMILLPHRCEVPKWPRRSIGLKAWLDNPSGGDPCLPGIAETHPAIAGELADLLGQEQVDGIDCRADLFAQ